MIPRLQSKNTVKGIQHVKAVAIGKNIQAAASEASHQGNGRADMELYFTLKAIGKIIESIFVLVFLALLIIGIILSNKRK